MAAALAFALSAGVLGLALRRFARVPAFAVMVLALLPLLLTGRALLTGGVYGAIDMAYTSEPLASIAEEAGVTHIGNPVASDVYAQFIPWHAAVREAIRQHQWPLWNPFELCGNILAAAVQSAPYHPLHLLALLLPLPSALTFIASMVFFLAAVSMFLFVRPLVSTDAPALLAGAIWMLAPHVGGFALTAYALALCTMPLVLLAARNLARMPSRRTMWRLTAALTVTVLAGHPETTLHIVAVSGLYLLYERWRAGDSQWSAAVWRGLLAGGVALLLTAFALLPFLEATRQTAEYRDRQAFVAVSWKPIRSLRAIRDALLPTQLPHAVADPEATPGAAYAGSVALALAAIGFARKREWFFLALFAIGLLAGSRAVIFSDALRMLPMFSIAANEHLIWCSALAIAVLAALGLEGATRRQLVVAFAAIAIVYALALSSDLRSPAAMRSLLPLILCGAAGALARRPSRETVLAILLLFLVQRAGETAPFRSFVPRTAFYPPFHGLDLLRGMEPFRIVGQHSILPSDIAAHYRLEDARGYQAMTLGRFAEAETFWSAPQSTWSNRVETLDSPFLSLMNVRYALSKAGLPLPPGWKLLARFDGYDVVENGRALARAFVPATVHSGATRAEAFHGVEMCGDFASEAWIEGGERGTLSNGPGTLITRAAGSKLDIRASMTSGGWIVLSESAWDGWHAAIDGKPSPVRIADATFLSVYVPRGEHHVRLVYRPLSFLIGGAISGLTALALLVMFLSVGAGSQPARPRENGPAESRPLHSLRT